MKKRKLGNQGLAVIRLLGFSLLAVTIAAQADDPKLVTVETVATFDGPMPTGVTISREGRHADRQGGPSQRHRPDPLRGL